MLQDISASVEGDPELKAMLDPDKLARMQDALPGIREAQDAGDDEALVKRAGAAIGTPQRFVIVAEVDDAVGFDEKFQSAPADVAQGYDLSKAPTEETIEFYVEAGSEDEALQQFNEALAFVGQSAKSAEVHDA
jgi:hypothetical protein